jgi:hypothetical protein
LLQYQKYSARRITLSRSSISPVSDATPDKKNSCAWDYPQNEIDSREYGVLAQFVIKRVVANRRKKMLERRNHRGLKFWKKPLVLLDDSGLSDKNTFWDSLKLLNEQRKNVVKLAGYNAPIVAPSFTLLLLGALTTSIIPQILQ